MVLAYWFISVFILCVDYQNRAGNKGAGIANASDAAIDRRERLRRLAMETIDISKVRRLYAPSTWSRGVGSSIEDAFLLLFFSSFLVMELDDHGPDIVPGAHAPFYMILT